MLCSTEYLFVWKTIALFILEPLKSLEILRLNNHNDNESRHWTEANTAHTQLPASIRLLVYLFIHLFIILFIWVGFE